MKNALHGPLMANNLIPPFIMREAGLVVNDVLQIHTNAEDLKNKMHCIVSDEDNNGTDLKIPLRFNGIFSCFPTRKLKTNEVEACKYIPTVALCPDLSTWGP